MFGWLRRNKALVEEIDELKAQVMRVENERLDALTDRHRMTKALDDVLKGHRALLDDMIDYVKRRHMNPKQQNLMKRLQKACDYTATQQLEEACKTVLEDGDTRPPRYRLEKIVVGDEDVIVVFSDKALSEAAVDRIRKELQALFENHKVIMFEEGMRMGIVKSNFSRKERQAAKGRVGRCGSGL